MSNLSISKKHALSHKAAMIAAEHVAKDLQQRFALRYKWDGDRCAFERPGLTGELVVGTNDIRLDCTLGFLLSAIKPAIERAVHREFDSLFAPAAPADKPVKTARSSRTSKTGKAAKR